MARKKTTYNNLLGTFLLWLGFFYPNSITHAQDILTKELNTPIAGDILIGKFIEDISIFEKGNKCIWNLQDASILKRTRSISFWEGDTAEVIPTLVGSTIYDIGGIGKDTLSIIRQEDNFKKSISNIPEIAMIFPFHYGDSIKGYFYDTGSYCDKLKHRTFGRYALSADREGTLILPNGDSLSNTLQIHKKSYSASLFYPNDVPLSPSETFTKDSINFFLENGNATLCQDITWLFCKGFRYPLIEKVTSWIIQNKKNSLNEYTIFFNPYEQNYLALDDTNRKLRKDNVLNGENSSTDIKAKNKNIISYHMVQDKLSQSIIIEYTLNQDASVEGIISDTKGIAYSKALQHHKAGDNYTMVLSYQNLPPKQTFVVNISTKGILFSEKFNKQ